MFIHLSVIAGVDKPQWATLSILLFDCEKNSCGWVVAGVSKPYNKNA